MDLIQQLVKSLRLEGPIRNGRIEHGEKTSEAMMDLCRTGTPGKSFRLVKLVPLSEVGTLIFYLVGYIDIKHCILDIILGCVPKWKYTYRIAIQKGR